MCFFYNSHDYKTTQSTSHIPLHRAPPELVYNVSYGKWLGTSMTLSMCRAQIHQQFPQVSTTRLQLRNLNDLEHGTMPVSRQLITILTFQKISEQGDRCLVRSSWDFFVFFGFEGGVLRKHKTKHSAFNWKFKLNFQNHQNKSVWSCN